MKIFKKKLTKTKFENLNGTAFLNTRLHQGKTTWWEKNLVGILHPFWEEINEKLMENSHQVVFPLDYPNTRIWSP